ncbi:hypothetical protein CBR_g61481 [Chara braunii]|uniref:Anaphase-promoting complex subunit 5 domain-containing protein n=1 Tax=Chara braunii TaxID=69332 RepID=A0A388K8Q9_CHABU|nr:hypothetical protein CBR_g61481 [Chara braunii]|eukprot:GBG66438.1 hypothetical protein CBR_g61481 [Chara braunii]
MGEINFALEEYQEALQWQYKHYELADHLGDVEEKERALTQLGRTHLELYESHRDEAEGVEYLESADVFFTRSLTLCKDHIEDDRDEHLGNAYNNLGLVELLKGNLQKAKQLLNKALVHCSACSTRPNAMEPLSRVFNSLGQLYAAEGNHEMALDSMRNDKAICKQIGHVQGEAKACLNIGQLHCEFDHFDEAIASFEEALLLARSLRDETFLIKSVEEDLKLALLLKKGEEDLKAGQAELANLEKMRPDEARWGGGGGGGGGRGVDVNSVQCERKLLLKLVTCAENLERWEQMKALASKLVDLERAVGDKSGLCDGLSLLGIAYEELGSYKEAVKCHKDTLWLARQIGSIEVLGRALGGVTGRAEVGWEMGVREVSLEGVNLEGKPYAKGLPRVIRIFEVHQDQVTTIPPGAELLGSSGRTPVEMFAVGNHVLAIQGHPEFSKEIVEKFIQLRVEAGIVPVMEIRVGKNRLGGTSGVGFTAVMSRRPSDSYRAVNKMWNSRCFVVKAKIPEKAFPDCIAAPNGFSYSDYVDALWVIVEIAEGRELETRARIRRRGNTMELLLRRFVADHQFLRSALRGIAVVLSHGADLGTPTQRRLVVLLDSVKKLHLRRKKAARRKVNREESVPETQPGGGLSEIEDDEVLDAGGSTTTAARDRAYLRRKRQVGRQGQKPRRAKKAADVVYGSAVRNKRRPSVPSRTEAVDHESDHESDPYAFETADEHGDKENVVAGQRQNAKEKEGRVQQSTPRRNDKQARGSSGRTSTSPTFNSHSTGLESCPLKRRRGFQSTPGQ